MIPQLLSSDEEIQVVGTAMDGVFALKKMEELKPDVVTLDVDMPRMDGIETLRRIAERFGTPVIMVSSLTERGAMLTLQALEIGAFDFVTKPHDAISVNIKDIAEELVAKVKAAAQNPLARLRVRKIESRVPPAAKKTGRPTRTAGKVLAIGISTGGPNALSYLLPRIPRDFPAAIVIVQHMPAGFTEMFATRLNANCAIEVKEAREGDLVVPGRALIAPGGRHLKIKRLPLGTITVLSDAQPQNGHRPSADVLFRSVASEYGCNATGLIMTGMGTDGAEGMGEIKGQGGMTVAQDEKSCVVFGMPKIAIERKYIREIVPLGDMDAFLMKQFMGKEVSDGTAVC
jgi:two-component system chemotaxis response regulator CheB